MLGQGCFSFPGDCVRIAPERIERQTKPVRRMSFDFINPLLLTGLAGIALPVLAHLLSKKKYDVVQWGAMQFLELGRNTRRRIRLEELLLLLFRMLLVAILALALARPWVSGGLFSRLSSTLCAGGAEAATPQTKRRARSDVCALGRPQSLSTVS